MIDQEGQEKRARELVRHGRLTLGVLPWQRVRSRLSDLPLEGRFNNGRIRILFALVLVTQFIGKLL